MLRIAVPDSRQRPAFVERTTFRQVFGVSHYGPTASTGHAGLPRARGRPQLDGNEGGSGSRRIRRLLPSFRTLPDVPRCNGPPGPPRPGASFRTPVEFSKETTAMPPRAQQHLMTENVWGREPALPS